MPEAAVKTKATQKVIAPPHQRHFRAAIFQTYILMASMVFVGLAVAAHFVPYFAIDLTVTRAVQSNHGALVDQLMRDISWIGFAPQAFILALVVVVALYVAGLRWEAVSAIFAAGNVALGTVIKLIVLRPRPDHARPPTWSTLNGTSRIRRFPPDTSPISPPSPDSCAISRS